MKIIAVLSYFTIFSCSSVKKTDNPPIPSLIEEEKLEEKDYNKDNKEEFLSSEQFESWTSIYKVQIATDEDLRSCVGDICIHLFPDIEKLGETSQGEQIDVQFYVLEKIEHKILLVSKENDQKIEGDLYGVSAIDNHPTYTIRFSGTEKDKITSGVYYIKEYSSESPSFKFTTPLELEF